MDLEEDSTVYRWERGANVQNTLEAVKEDEQGNIITTSHDADRERSQKAKALRLTQSVRRGIIRFVVLALDTSLAAKETDYFPTRLTNCKDVILDFIKEFYDQNPISQLSFAITSDRIATKLTELSGNPRYHIEKCMELNEVKGLASLQNIIILAIATLKYTPTYGYRELFIIFNSLSTCDPGDIFKTVEDAKRFKIRISIICLAAEVYICKKICEMTGGQFSVAMDREHLKELMNVHTVPPPETVDGIGGAPGTTSTSANTSSSSQLVTDFIYMGFPKLLNSVHRAYAFDGKTITTSTTTFQCPRCATRTTDIPTSCCVCSLQLNSSSHIARSYHHLFPVPNFIEFTVIYDKATEEYAAIMTEKVMDPDTMMIEIDGDEDTSDKAGTGKGGVEIEVEGESEGAGATTAAGAGIIVKQEIVKEESGSDGKKKKEKIIPLVDIKIRCHGCLQLIAIANKVVFQCPRCVNLFCVECDLFIHDSLHNCPGCHL